MPEPLRQPSSATHIAAEMFRVLRTADGSYLDKGGLLPSRPPGLIIQVDDSVQNVIRSMDLEAASRKVIASGFRNYSSLILYAIEIS